MSSFLYHCCNRRHKTHSSLGIFTFKTWLCGKRTLYWFSSLPSLHSHSELRIHEYCINLFCICFFKKTQILGLRWTCIWYRIFYTHAMCSLFYNKENSKQQLPLTGYSFSIYTVLYAFSVLSLNSDKIPMRAAAIIILILKMRR